MHFRKSHVYVPDKLDVQETDFSFTQFYRSWNHFSGCRFTHGRDSRSHSLGIGVKYFMPYRTEQMDPRESHGGTPSAVVKPNIHNSIPIKHTNFIVTNTYLSIFHPTQYILVLVPCCMSLKTMRQWLRWLWKAEVTRWDMFQGPTELLEIGCVTGLIWTPKIRIRHIDSKHQVADILTKGNFTRDEWNHLLRLFNISHFSSLRCTKKFQHGWLRYDDKKNSGTRRRRKGCVQVATSSGEYVFLSHVVKFLCSFKSDCIKKFGDVWSFGETW